MWQCKLGVLFVLALLLAGWYYWSRPAGWRLSPGQIEKVVVRPKGSGHSHTLDAAEAAQVLNWFNSGTGIVDNSHHGAPGCGAHSSVNFYLKSGEIVSVVSYMRVTRGRPGSGLDDLTSDFYFTQPDLKQYLRDWDARSEAGGC